MSNFSSPFRDPVQNVRYTKALFFEVAVDDKSNVMYTLKDKDHKGYPSLYRLYMDMADPLEINFAEAYLDGWEHWQMICDTVWFKPYIKRWRHELQLKLRAEALLRIRDIAKDETHRGSLAANKILLDGGWQTKEDTKKVGRKSKDEIKAEAERLFVSEKDALADLERIN